MAIEKKRLVVWGIGKHATKNIIPAIKSQENIELYGIFTRNKKSSKKLSKEFDCKFWIDEKDCLSDKDIDIVYLSTPPALHYPQGLKVLESNKHLWCEKPLTTNFKHAKHLVDISIEKDLSICEGYMYQYHPHFNALKRIISDKILGDIKTIHSTFNLPELDDPGFRFNPKLGGSCLLDVGTYPISLIMKLFEGEEIELIDTNLILDQDNGVDISGSAELSITSRRDISCNLVWGYNRSYVNVIELSGTLGKLRTEKIFSKSEDYNPTFEIENLYGEKEIKIVDSSNHFEIMFRSFYETIYNEKKLNLQRNNILTLHNFLNIIQNNREGKNNV